MNRSLRYGLLGLGVVLACVGIVTGIFLSLYLKRLTPRFKARVVQVLDERFDADVDLKSLEVSLFPQPTVEGQGLRIQHRGWNNAHPLIAIRRFRATADFLTLAARGRSVSLVTLEGLEMHLPARSGGQTQTGPQMNPKSDKDGYSKKNNNQMGFLIETMVANGASLEIEPKVPGKDPLQFNIRELTIHSLGQGKAMNFTAQLTNAKPPGLIDSAGHFGPWQREDPRSTPLAGDYKFQNADLSVFKGISGILSSVGQYRGELQHIEVDGKTDVPDFSLQPKGDPVHLTTQFHSVVDGTNGDTVLDPVDATFLKSEFVCRGGVVHVDGQQGKTVSLVAVPKHARIEDILKLVIGGKTPVLTGDVDFRTKIEIPPSQRPVIDKLKLDGSFALSQGFFTSPNVQRRLNELSERARGISKHEADNDNAATATAATDLHARFKLDGGLATFSQLSFGVPAARVELAGSYNLGSEKVDLSGKFAMQATLSETQSGVRHVLLKPLDPLFKKDSAGFEVPVEITGTKDQPEVGTKILHKKIHIH